MADHPTTDRLVELAAGLLPRDERDPLRKHLERCPECDGAFREALRQQELLCARLAPSVQTTPARRAPWWWAGVAVAALVVVAVLRFEGAAGEGALDYWLPVEHDTSATRSVAVDTRLDAALAAYAERRLDRAESLLAEGLDGWIETRRLLYLASTRLALEDVEGARAALDAVAIETVPQPWRRRARRVQIQLDCASGDTVAAARRRDDLREEPGPIGLWAAGPAATCPGLTVDRR